MQSPNLSRRIVKIGLFAAVVGGGIWSLTSLSSDPQPATAGTSRVDDGWYHFTLWEGLLFWYYDSTGSQEGKEITLTWYDSAKDEWVYSIANDPWNAVNKLMQDGFDLRDLESSEPFQSYAEYNYRGEDGPEDVLWIELLYSHEPNIPDGFVEYLVSRDTFSDYGFPPDFEIPDPSSPCCKTTTNPMCAKQKHDPNNPPPPPPGTPMCMMSIYEPCLICDLCCESGCCGESCLPKGSVCCNGSPCSGVCCHGECKASGSQCCPTPGHSCPPGKTCCDTDCCTIGSQKCCNNMCLSNCDECCGNGCCGQDDDCCNDQCWPSDGTCCGGNPDYYCPVNTTCCNGRCCTPDQACCNGVCQSNCDVCCYGNCYEAGTDCCGNREETCGPGLDCCEDQGCCPEGHDCCGVNDCCPPEQTCCGGSCRTNCPVCCNGVCYAEGTLCCPEGHTCGPGAASGPGTNSVCCGDTCCADSVDCCSGACCAPGQACCHGECTAFDCTFSSITVGESVCPGGATELQLVGMCNQECPGSVRVNVVSQPENATVTVLDEIPCDGSPHLVRVQVHSSPDSAFGPIDFTLTNRRETCQISATVDVVPTVWINWPPLIGEAEVQPGAFVCVNNDDDNNDGVPDWETTGIIADEDDLSPFLLYATPDAIHAPGTTFILRVQGAKERIRLYRNQDRSEPVPLASGELIAPATEFPLGVYYIEGIEASSTSRDVSISFEYSGVLGTCGDKVNVSVVDLDLDVDSDNTNGTGLPDQSSEEDTIEDSMLLADFTGKLVPSNTDNDDDPEAYLDEATVRERIDDYGDGFNLDGSLNEDDTNPSEDEFVPVRLSISPALDTANLSIRFRYDAAYPGSLTFSDESSPTNSHAPPNRRRIDLNSDSSLRLWLNRTDRNGSTVAQGGDLLADFATTGEVYSAPSLGLSNSVRTVTLYLEGVSPSSAFAEHRIVVEADLDGDGPDSFRCTDAVRSTVSTVSFSADSTLFLPGFDDTIVPNGLMVPTGFGTTCAYSVQPAIPLQFASEDNNIVNHVIDLSGLLVINSISSGNTNLLARTTNPDMLTLGMLRVVSLPRRNVSVRFHRVSDNAGHATAFNASDAQSALERMNSIWNGQANIYFVADGDLFVSDPQLDADLGDIVSFSGRPQHPNLDMTDWEWVVQHADPDIDWNIFVVWDYEATEGANVARAATLPGITLADMDSAINLGTTCAHEGGHHLANDSKHFNHPYEGGPPADDLADWALFDNIMGVAQPFHSEDPLHLTLRQAVLANLGLAE